MHLRTVLFGIKKKSRIVDFSCSNDVREEITMAMVEQNFAKNMIGRNEIDAYWKDDDTDKQKKNNWKKHLGVLAMSKAVLEMHGSLTSPTLYGPGTYQKDPWDLQSSPIWLRQQLILA